MFRSFLCAACLAAVCLLSKEALAQRVRARTSPPLPAPAVPGAGIHTGHYHGGVGHVGGVYGNSLNLSFGFGGFPGRSYYFSSGFPYGGFGLGGFGYGNPYGIYYNPGANYLDYYLPPVYAPAELAYGPQAMQRFVGPPAVDPFGGIPGGLGAGAPAARPVERAPAVDGDADARPSVRVSNLESRRRAGHFVTAGDELFRAQRYHEALQKYKSAAEAAPDVAESYFRQGHALTATGRYDLAAAAFKRGLAIGPEWADAAFRLDSIYGDAELVKESHVENLAKALLERPSDTDLIFVLAMFLHYDGDPARAGRFFAKAGELAGRDGAYLKPFLPADAAVARPAPGIVPKPKAPAKPAELPGVEA